MDLLDENKKREYIRRLLLARLRLLNKHSFYGLLLMNAKFGLDLKCPTAYTDGKKICFAYVYETEGSIILLAKMNSDYANKLKEKHKNVNFSAFPKQKDTWYSLVIDDTYTKEEFESIIDFITK